MSGFKLPEGLVGLEIPTLEKKIRWRETMNYAAAVRDANPRYLDDARTRIVAHPCYPVALTWPLVERLEGLLQQKVKREILATKVHATELLRLHRPVRPGDVLHIGGKIAGIRPTRAGALLVVTFRATDSTGEVVFTERIGALFRGVEAQAEGESPPPEPHSSEEFSWDTPVKIPREAAHLYDGCTGIVFPIHTSRAFALKAGLPDILLQGTCTLATVCREVVNRTAGGEPARVRRIACRFTGFLLPGNTVTIQGTDAVEDGSDLRVDARVLDPNNEAVLVASFNLSRP